ncbi:hypothetical protein ACJIZ3_024449 [Penstemon smallii]|uniref:AB hydrolase-1 domain-containing protein n=1 Tax=Penstemon smallii TaxID=265156 RepID=A0ABD3TTX9_9LAMI
MVMRKDLATTMNTKIMGKETIVLAHGYGADQTIWDKVLPDLAARYHVVVFDWCFSGAVKDSSLYDPIRYSSYDDFGDDLISLMDELKLKSCVFVGHSMSGMIGCIASVKRPDLFKRLVLVSASPRLINTDDYEGGYEMSHIEQLLSSIESNFEEWATNFASLVVDSNDPLSIQKFEDCLKRMKPEVALSVAKTVFLGDYRYILNQVVTPCNIIQSKHDIVVPDSVPKYIQSQIKKTCEIDIIDTEGHFPQLTGHVQFIEVLDRILMSC